MTNTVTSLGNGNPPYVVSEDIHLLLAHWAVQRGFRLPDICFFRDLRDEMAAQLGRYFSAVKFVPEATLMHGFRGIFYGKGYPVVSLDQTYNPYGRFSISQTRLVDSKLDDIGAGSRNKESVRKQIELIASDLGKGRPVQLVDDVVFSGRSLSDLIAQLQENGVPVARVVAGVLIGEGREEILARFPDIEVDSVAFFPEVVDEVCERDFYVGVPLSGRLIGEGGVPMEPHRSAPYLLPFGNPGKWASIPPQYQREWSFFCICQSIKLWKAIEQATGRSVHCEDLDRKTHGFPGEGPLVPALEEYALRTKCAAA